MLSDCADVQADLQKPDNAVQSLLFIWSKKRPHAKGAAKGVATRHVYTYSKIAGYTKPGLSVTQRQLSAGGPRANGIMIDISGRECRYIWF